MNLNLMPVLLFRNCFAENFNVIFSTIHTDCVQLRRLLNCNKVYLCENIERNCQVSTAS